MNSIKLLKAGFLVQAIVIVFLGYGYISGCTHEDELLVSQGPDIVRGNEKVELGVGSTTFDKTHSNVGWETLYLGSTSLLTGRFDNFGFTTFNFDESNVSGTNFEGWVWLNSVNTSEPGRDDGCLLGTYGTDMDKTTEQENLAIIKSKSVELSTTDKGYLVKADLTFHGVTKEVTAKLSFDGKATTTSTTGTRESLGFRLEFQILAKTDFLIESSSIGDKVDIICNAIFRRTI